MLNYDHGALDRVTQALLRWLDAADAYLKKQGTVPWRVGARRWFRIGDYAFGHEDVELVGWSVEDLAHARSIPQWDAAVQSMMADDWVKAQFDHEGVSFDRTWRQVHLGIIPHLLFRPYASRSDDAEPMVTDETRDNARFFVQWLFARSVRAVALIPLFGLSGHQGFDLAEGVQLRRADDEMLRRLLDAGVLPASFASQIFSTNSTPQYVLKLTLEHPKRLGREPEKEDGGVHVQLERRASVVSALSLLLKGRFEVSGAYLGYEPMDVFGGAVLTASTEMYRLVAAGDVDTVAPRFAVAYNAVESVDKAAGLGLALRRLSQSATREYLEDRILDLMIAAETLFLRDDRAELTFKLAVRCAYYIAPNDSVERRKIYDTMRAAYNQRGNVAHGNHADTTVSVAGKKMPTAKFFDDVESIIRRALQRLLLETPADRRKIDYETLVLGPSRPAGSPMSETSSGADPVDFQ